MNNTFPKITDTLKGWIQRGKRGIIAKNQEANSQFFYYFVQESLSVEVNSHNKFIVFYYVVSQKRIDITLV